MTAFKLGKERTTGKAISIDAATRGLSCDCVCYDCGKAFVAAKGEKNDWHFRHYEETTCIGGQETALHKLAKQLIEEGSEIVLKKYGKVAYYNAKQEIQFQTIQPDVSALLKPIGQDFFFEVLVTHAVDSKKRNFYNDGEHKSVEINLKNYSFTTVEKLRNDILNNSDFNEAIFWEKKVAAEISKDNSWVMWLVFGVVGFFGLKFLFQRRR